MIDHARPAFQLTGIRIGRTDLGAGNVEVDGDAIVLTVHSSTDERPIRVPLSAVEHVGVTGSDVALALRDGMRLTISSDNATQLADDIVDCCRAIPELTSHLRAFGSRRGHRSTRASGPTEQQRFFAPLLDARRTAVDASRADAAIAAFDAKALGSAFDAALRSFASERHGENGPARRALEAELVDLAEPLHNALAALGVAAAEASDATDDLTIWRAWSAQLRATFETADRVWLTLDVALDAVGWRP